MITVVALLTEECAGVPVLGHEHRVGSERSRGRPAREADRGCTPLALHSKRSAVRARLVPQEVPGQSRVPNPPAGFEGHLTVI